MRGVQPAQTLIQDGFAIEGGDCGPVDCDDTNPAINPDAEEVCDDGIDNNCDGQIDEGCLIEVAVDIKPGSCPNPIKLKQLGVMPFAIMGTVEFDVTQIDPASIRLSREGDPGEVAPLRWSYYDAGIPNEEFDPTLCNCVGYGYDGIIDLALKFNVQSVIKTLKLAEVVGQTIPLTMTGKLKEEFGGTPIRGEDCVWVLKR